MAELRDRDTLLRGSVVANCAMNRDRRLHGVNSYERELDFDPIERLRSPGAGWLDLCCGSGRALVDASRLLSAVALVGVAVRVPRRG